MEKSIIQDDISFKDLFSQLSLKNKKENNEIYNKILLYYINKNVYSKQHIFGLGITLKAFDKKIMNMVNNSYEDYIKTIKKLEIYRKILEKY